MIRAPASIEDSEWKGASKVPHYSTSPEDRSLSESEDDEQSELTLEEFLIEFPGYSEPMGRCLVRCPFKTGQKLMELKASGFKMSEEDPLVHVIIDVGNADAVAFYNGGNYTLPAGALGALPWPGNGVPPQPGAALPAGVVALPPAALGRFISTLTGVVNKSGAISLSE
eukprot:gene25712-31051_t